MWISAAVWAMNWPDGCALKRELVLWRGRPQDEQWRRELAARRRRSNKKSDREKRKGAVCVIGALWFITPSSTWVRYF